MPLKYKIKKCETVKQVMTEFKEVGFRLKPEEDVS